MPRRELLDRHPPLLLHQVDEAEIAGAEHDDVAARDVVLLLLRLPPRRLGCSVADHRLLLVTARECADAAVGEVPLHELVQAVAVALPERRALRLSVVREDNERIRPRSKAAGARRGGGPLIQLSQWLQGGLAAEARRGGGPGVAPGRRGD